MQEIYINLDDSGKLTKKEVISVYGGVVFLSKKEKDKFITQYRNIINEIKCKYCYSYCNKKCPEIKNTNIKPKDKRRLINYIKKYFVVGLIVNNKNVYDYIIENKAAKGRFLDYSIRRMIKEIVSNFIDNKIIDPNKDLKLIINIDEQTTKSNGYYNLKEGLYEELKYGINNYNYGKTFSPLIKGDLLLSLTYHNSSKSYVVQSADLIAGTIRRKSLEKESDIENILNFKLILP